MNKHKLLFILVSLVLSIAILAGCGAAGTTQEPTQTVAAATTATEAVTTIANSDAGAANTDKELVRWLYPNAEGKHHQELTDYINELLDKDDMNIEFVAIPMDWDVWEQRTNLMFQTNEEFELIQVLEGFGPGYVEYWNRNAGVRLNEMLDEYAPVLKSSIPDWLWESASIKGNITTIPAFWVETAHLKGGVSMRKDLYDKYGMSLPTNLDELLTKSIELKEYVTNDKLFDRPTYIFMRYHEIQTFPHRSYDTFPFTVIDQLLLVRQDGTVESWIDSEEFKKDCEFYNTLYKNNLVNPEILSAAEIDADFVYGNYLYSDWNTLDSDANMKKNAGDDSIDNVYVIFNTDKPIMRAQGVRNSNMVSVTSPNPEAAVRFHEWFYANPQAYIAMQFGKEGLTYNMVGDEVYPIPDEPNLGLPLWMIGNINLQPVTKDSNPEWLKYAMHEEMNAVNSITIGFAFDSIPVDVQYAACLSEMKNVIYPMRAGVVSYEEGYGTASAALKAAGIDEIVVEYEKQLKEWLDNR